eukprot:TRINITY_DN1560_c0_g1_i1.p1 TRINITY_DN1560_c0_g1~~TRINITY_DN1560_c0_g1_i1.p1  ORF type:complete len:346 (+),score=103.58 TRINITY_DN1560_c0_g1_i1:38-1039(+)
MLVKRFSSVRTLRRLFRCSFSVTPSSSSSSSPSSSSSSSSSSPSPTKLFDPKEYKQAMTKAIYEKLKAQMQARASGGKWTPNYIDAEPNLLSNCWISEPVGPSKGTLIWLPSIGERKEYVQQLFSLMPPQHMRLVVPEPPPTKITRFEGTIEPAWFDVTQERPSDEEEEDEYGIKYAVKLVTKLIKDEAKRMKDTRTLFVAGFGQGAAMAIHAGLNFHQPLGGIASLCGYVIQTDKYPGWIHPANRHTSVLAVNGRMDLVVGCNFAKSRFEVLKQSNVPCEWRQDFSLDHRMTGEHLWQLQEWWQDRLQHIISSPSSPSSSSSSSLNCPPPRT